MVERPALTRNAEVRYLDGQPEVYQLTISRRLCKLWTMAPLSVVLKGNATSNNPFFIRLYENEPNKHIVYNIVTNSNI